MNPNEDFCHYSGAKLRQIYAISHRLDAINSLLDVFGDNEDLLEPLASEYQAIANCLFRDFEQTMEILVQLIEEGIE